METSVIFLHLDSCGSGNYTSLLNDSSRRLSTELAGWASDMLSANGAIHAAHRGGDAVNAVFRDFTSALRASRVVRREWRGRARHLKNTRALRSTPVDWPGVRIAISAERADASTVRILDDNLHVWEALTSIKGSPCNAILARDNVVPDPQLLRAENFQPLLKPVSVRKGHHEAEWNLFIELAPTQIGSFEFDGEILPPLSAPVPSTQVTITGNLDWALVTDRAVEAIRRDCASWMPRLPRVPQPVLAAFAEKNRQRKMDAALGVSEETGGILLRLVADPMVEDPSLDLQVAPLSWELFSSSIPYPNMKIPNARGNYIPTDSVIGAIQRFLRQLPEVYPGSKAPWPMIGPRNIVPLGLEVLVLTSDNRVLLRQKDLTTTVGAGKWDISFSGYARFAADFGVTVRPERGIFEVDVASWAAREFQREVGTSPGNLEGFRILGVHGNRHTGARDLLAFLPIQASSLDLAHSISLEDQRKRLRSRCRAGEFPERELEIREQQLVQDFERSLELAHSRGVPEREVWGARNRFVPFTPEEVGRFLRERRGTENDDPYPRWGILPEALGALLLAIVHVHGSGAVENIERAIGDRPKPPLQPTGSAAG